MVETVLLQVYSSTTNIDTNDTEITLGFKYRL